MDNKIEIQKLLSDLSLQFIALPWSQIDKYIERAISILAEPLGYDMGIVFDEITGHANIGATHLNTIDLKKKFCYYSEGFNFSWFNSRIHLAETTFFHASEILPGEAENEKTFFAENNIESALIIQLKFEDEILGGVVLASFRGTVCENKFLIEYVSVLKGILSSALDRRNRGKLLLSQQQLLERNLAFEKTVSEISSGFISIPLENIAVAIKDALKYLSDFLHADRLLILEEKTGIAGFQATYQFVKEGIDNYLSKDFESDYPWLSNRTKKGLLTVILSPDGLPDEAEKDKKLLKEIGLKTNITLPLSSAGDIIGALLISSFTERVEWIDELKTRLKFIGEIFASVLQRKNKESELAEVYTHFNSNKSELDSAIEFERKLAHISSDFISLPWEEIDTKVVESIGSLVDFWGFERSNLSQFEEEAQHLLPVHQYVKAGVQLLQSDNYSALFPYLSKSLLQGKEVIFVHPSFRNKYINEQIAIKDEKQIIFSDYDTFPEDARNERDYVYQNGFKANCNIPLVIGERIIGAWSMAAFSHHIEFTESLLERIRKASKVFALALDKKNKNRKYEDLHSELKTQSEILRNTLSLEKTISELSNRFINIDWKNIDEEMENGIKLLVDNLRFERGTLLMINENRDDFIRTYQYPPSQGPSTGFKEMVPWYIERLLLGEDIIIETPDDFPAEAVNERQRSKESPFQSTITVPLRISDKIIGAIGFTTYSVRINWSQELIRGLRMVRDIYANALSRKLNEMRIVKYQEQLKEENIILKEEMRGEYDFLNIIGQSEVMSYVFNKVRRVAPLDTLVLLEGETGVGKQLFAYAVHSLSSRSHRALLSVNCAALPANLIESELFGHEKGAFTGADRTVKGRFEIADGGTLFLDEIGELPLELQSKLLRVLQDGEFERLGSSKTIKVDVRVLAATNRILKDEIKEGRFRKDLYYRITAYPITIPPLRERKEDIPHLIRYYVDKYSAKIGKKVELIAKQTYEELTTYSWPGNIRELENVIERAVITMKGTTLRISELLEEKHRPDEPFIPLDEKEKQYIIQAIQYTSGRIEGQNGAASLLGVNPSTLRGKMRKYGIQLKKDIV